MKMHVQVKYRPLGHAMVSATCEVADAPFHTQGNDILP